MNDFGKVEVVYVHNRVIGRDLIVIDQADEHVLIHNDVAQKVFDHPNQNAWGEILLEPAELFIVINGHNRQVRYKLNDYNIDERVWAATLVDDSDHTREEQNNVTAQH